MNFLIVYSSTGYIHYLNTVNIMRITPSGMQDGHYIVHVGQSRDDIIEVSKAENLDLFDFINSHLWQKGLNSNAKP